MFKRAELECFACLILVTLIGIKAADSDFGKPLSEAEINEAKMRLYHFSETEMETDFQEPRKPCSMPLKSKKVRNYNERLSKRWPNGMVPYTISATYSNESRIKVTKGLVTIEDNSCVKFVPKESHHKQFIFITDADNSACFATLGYSQDLEEHTVNLAVNGCLTLDTVVHELLHILGSDHEQSRPDRDDFIKVTWSNIDNSQKFNFVKNQWMDDPTRLALCPSSNPPPNANFEECASGQRVYRSGFPYDYGSVMQYARGDFAIDMSKDTMTPINTSVTVLGNLNGMTLLDIRKLRAAYGCGSQTGDACTMRVSGLSGTITTQDEVAECSTLVSVPFESFIVVTMESLEMKGGDSIKLFDGDSSKGNLLETLNASNPEAKVVVTRQNQIYFQFRLKDNSKFTLHWTGVEDACCEEITLSVGPSTFIAVNSFLSGLMGTYSTDGNTTSVNGIEHPVLRLDKNRGFFMAASNEDGIWYINEEVEMRHPGISSGFMFLSSGSSPTKSQTITYPFHSELRQEPNFSVDCNTECGKPPDVANTKPVVNKASKDGSVAQYECKEDASKTLYAICMSNGVWKMLKEDTCEAQETPITTRPPQAFTMGKCGGKLEQLIVGDNVTITYPTPGEYKQNQACTWSLRTSKGRFKAALKGIHLQITKACSSHHVMLSKLPGVIRFCGYGTGDRTHEYFSKNGLIDMNFKPDVKNYTAPVLSFEINVVA